MSEEIRVYAACLASYNSGILHGKWIDATQGVESIQDEINAMLKDSPIEGAEEYAIHDYEGFGSWSLSEYTGIEEIHEMACFLEEHGKLGEAVLSHWCGDLDYAAKALSDSYCGCYESLADYAQQLTEETCEIHQHIAFYIDYEKMGQDMAINDVYAIETAYDEVHVFWNF